MSHQMCRTFLHEIIAFRKHKAQEQQSCTYQGRTYRDGAIPSGNDSIGSETGKQLIQSREYARTRTWNGSKWVQFLNTTVAIGDGDLCDRVSFGYSFQLPASSFLRRPQQLSLLGIDNLGLIISHVDTRIEVLNDDS
jgi:hypothetical protein